MFHIPMSSPIMTTIFGFLSSAAAGVCATPNSVATIANPKLIFPDHFIATLQFRLYRVGNCSYLQKWNSVEVRPNFTRRALSANALSVAIVKTTNPPGPVARPFRSEAFHPAITDFTRESTQLPNTWHTSFVIDHGSARTRKIKTNNYTLASLAMPTSGTSPTISVPSLNAASTTSVPPTSRILSCIPTNPIPVAALPRDVLNPLPSSRIRKLTLLSFTTTSTWALCASLCLITLLSDSCATRNRHSATSLGIFTGRHSSENCTSILYFLLISLHNPPSADTSPTCCSRLECSSCDSEWMSIDNSLIPFSITSTLPRSSRSEAGSTFHNCPSPTPSNANLWLKSSCNSRAILARSSSCASIS